MNNNKRDAKEDSFVSIKGFNFKFDPMTCESCGGRCCYGESGYIWSTGDELRKIAGYVKIEFNSFLDEYTRKEQGKFTIKDIKIDGYYSCVFFDRINRMCTIYSVRPKQCRDFPFWEYCKENPEFLADECPGVEFNNELEE